MILAAYPTDDQPKSRKVCPHCGATPRGCASNHWLRGRWCCPACPKGDHDAPRDAA